MQNFEKQPDDILVAAFASGDNQAFDALLERHQSRIFNYIRHIVKDEGVSNDVFQETFVRVITTIKQGRYAADGKFVSWVMRIAHNIIIDQYRQEKSEATVSTDEADYDLLNRRELCDDTIEDIMAKPKANQKETVKFSYERIARFFPPEYSTKQMEDAIVRMLEERKREVGAMPAPRRRDDAERG